MFKRYNSNNIIKLLLILLQTCSIIDGRKIHKIEYLKPRRLVACTPASTPVDINAFAGVSGDITILGTLDGSARINIIGYQQACSTTTYTSAPATTSIVPTANGDGSVTFSGVQPSSSGRFSICLSCDNGATFSINVGVYRVEPQIVKNHTFNLYNNRIGYINVSGYGLDIIDRLKLVDEEYGCEKNDDPTTKAPETIITIPEVGIYNTYAIFGPFLPVNTTYVNKFQVCYAFDGITSM